MNPDGIIEALRRYQVPHQEIAEAIGRERSVATKLMAGTRRLQVEEVEPLLQLLRDKGLLDITNTPERPAADPFVDYVPVEVLPTFAGMGGGGTGDADREVAMVSRRLVVDELRARAADLLLINVRGNSMEPLFRHGDQLLVDRRDTSPTQPGPFALLYDDGYVVKNVAWIEKRTKLRVSSSNLDFAPEDFDPADVTILGRPVWFARRL
jgi:phage repressor protein C with HTH and peptisase S24 domain